MGTGSVIAIIIFSFIFILGFRSLFKRFYIINKGINTTATLVGLKQTEMGGGEDGSDRISYWPMIEFYDNEKLIKETLNQSMPNYVHYKKISITYLKSKNKYKIVNHENKPHFYIALIMTLISAFSLIYIIGRIL
ncbi:hypothetical protein [Spongiivirga citrea]|uniref:DUF3592 domain-containing protein n=1 Tax=Spongiivirga citrea TaxID=1481457 RepID=A0A6M0CF89_9FLAO|nr:hypothetical protein [Spongiivirga citrea]NER16496.1 hypothetical protein [Spongiivirga citrea]